MSVFSFLSLLALYFSHAVAYLLFAVSALAALLLVAIASVSFAWRYALHRCRARSASSARAAAAGKTTLAFFHPYCNGGGGGERVLWSAVAALARSPSARRLRVIVYCGDAAPARAGDDSSAAATRAALADARSRFGVSVPASLELEVVHVPGRWLLEAASWPRFTMAGQSLGGALFALRCLAAELPAVWIDTTGAAFATATAKLCGGCATAAYVHYPTITADMLAAVHARRPAHNNAAGVASSARATAAKLAYYHAFAAAYCAAGGCVDAAMANSLWTRAHLQALWRLPAPATGDAAGDDPVAWRRRVAEGGAAARSAGARSAAAASTSAASAASAAAVLRDVASPALTYRPLAGVLASLARCMCLVSEAEAPLVDYGRPAARVVYPPCNTDALSSLPLGWTYAAGGAAARPDGSAAAAAASSTRPAPRRCVTTRQRVVVSVGQFRPEKDHELQIRAFAAFVAKGEWRGEGGIYEEGSAWWCPPPPPPPHSNTHAPPSPPPPPPQTPPPTAPFVCASSAAAATRATRRGWLRCARSPPRPSSRCRPAPSSSS